MKKALIAGILAITANAFDEDRAAVMSCGMTDFLSKPIDINELLRTLNRVLDRN